MKIDLRSLLAGEIRTLPLSFTLERKKEEENSLSPLYEIDFPTPLAVNGEIVNNAGYIRLTLTLSLTYRAACARCLSEVNETLTFTVERTVITPKEAADIDEEALDEYLVTEDGFLDTEELIEDTLLLHFPSKMLCRADCKGLCPRCGKNLNEGDCGCKSSTPDPRLTGPLGKLLEQLKKEEAENK